MKVAIMPPYFFPYIGYFQMMQAVDVFVIYDNIQLTKKGWIKRNRILKEMPDMQHNYSYSHIFVGDTYTLTRDEFYDMLKNHNIYGKRYFYPLVSDFPMCQDLSSSKGKSLPNDKRLAEEVICLPIYPNLSVNFITNISNIINNARK